MAADNRDFVNKFANEGGGDIFVEDKRMEELKSATAKTASEISTSTDYIPLQDTDGNLVKINPASFQEAVRKTLGSLLANNDKGTTISGVPALSGSGASLDFGSVTPANLASVLGAIFYNTRASLASNSPIPNKAGLYYTADTWQGLPQYTIVVKMNNEKVYYNEIMFAINANTGGGLWFYFIGEGFRKIFSL